MNTKFSKILAIVAVAMMVTTVFGAIASDCTDGTGGGVASSNKDPEEVSSVTIDTTWTESREVWAGYPNVTYKMDDGVPTVTFKNANIKFELSTGGGTSDFGIKFNFDTTTNVHIILEGNNNIRAIVGAEKSGASVIVNGDSCPVFIHGSSMKDTLTITTQFKATSNSDYIGARAIRSGNWNITDCTMKFVLDQELDTFTCIRVSQSIYVDGVDCKRSRLYFSIGDIKDTYIFSGITPVNAGSFSFSDSIISARTSDKIDDTYSYMFSPNITPFVFNCCKLDIEMEKGKLFYHNIAQAVINFDEFNWIKLYADTAGEPKYIPGGTIYSLTGTDWDAVKIIVDSNVKEPTDDNVDGGLAITATIAVSVLLAVFAVFIILLGNRRRDDD